MFDLAAERLKRIHAQFLDSGEEFPQLHFLVVHPYGLEQTLPLDTAYPGADTIGLSRHAWREQFEVLDRYHQSPLNPLSDLWLRIDNQLWQGAFFHRQPNVEAERLKAQHDHLYQGIEEFHRLGDLAAIHFDLPADPDFLADARHLMRAKGSHRWLEKLHELGLYEADDVGAYAVRRLKADVFTASARAIEDLSTSRAPAAPTSDGDVSPAAHDVVRELERDRGQAKTRAAVNANERAIETQLDDLSDQMCFFGKGRPEVLRRDDAFDCWMVHFVRFVEVIKSLGLESKLKSLVDESARRIDHRGLRGAADLLKLALEPEAGYRIKQSLRYYHDHGALDGLGDVRDGLEYLCVRVRQPDPAQSPDIVSCATRPIQEPQSSPQTALAELHADGPSQQGWQFEAGLFKFRGRQYDLVGFPLLLLQRFVQSPLVALGYEQLKDVWGNYTPSEATIRTHLSTLRKVLKTVARDIGAAEDTESDPLPNKGGAWRFLLPKK